VPDGAVGGIVRSSPQHEALQFSYGFAWDNRNHDVVTRSGQYHSLLVDLNPGGAGRFPFSWGRADLTLRGYLPVVQNRLTLAVRLVVDALFGQPPFYELSRLRNTQAIGGGRGLRGVPAGRYHGMLKTFSNVELRSELFGFRALGKHNVLGLTGFVDTGRLFAHYRNEPELDGSGIGLKIGAGGGVRITAGSSFVVRADVAWSPDARPVGVYLLGGQPF
jgi:outer membrane protein assembly factor BamA